MWCSPVVLRDYGRGGNPQSHAHMRTLGSRQDFRHFSWSQAPFGAAALLNTNASLACLPCLLACLLAACLLAACLLAACLLACLGPLQNPGPETYPWARVCSSAWPLSEFGRCVPPSTLACLLAWGMGTNPQRPTPSVRIGTYSWPHSGIRQVIPLDVLFNPRPEQTPATSILSLALLGIGTGQRPRAERTTQMCIGPRGVKSDDGSSIELKPGQE